MNVAVKLSDGSITRQCTSTITVNDNTPPVVTCKSATLALNASLATLTPAMVLNSVSDNCTASLILSLSKTTFSCGDVGNNTVTLTAKDNRNNTGTCVAAVQVTNNPVSSFTCSPVTLYDINQSSLVYPINFDPQLVYSCFWPTTYQVGIFYKVGKTLYGCQDIGVHSITLKVVSVDDPESTALATCSTTLTVIDETPPQVTCKNITVELVDDQPVEISPLSIEASSGDLCGIATRVASKTIFSCIDMGPNTVTLTASGCFGPGNSADESSYIGYSLCGDGSITAHIAGLTLPGKAGIVMRESAAPGA